MNGCRGLRPGEVLRPLPCVASARVSLRPRACCSEEGGGEAGRSPSTRRSPQFPKPSKRIQLERADRGRDRILRRISQQLSQQGQQLTDLTQQLSQVGRTSGWVVQRLLSQDLDVKSLLIDSPDSLAVWMVPQLANISFIITPDEQANRFVDSVLFPGATTCFLKNFLCLLRESGCVKQLSVDSPDTPTMKSKVEEVLMCIKTFEDNYASDLFEPFNASTAQEVCGLLRAVRPLRGQLSERENHVSKPPTWYSPYFQRLVSFERALQESAGLFSSGSESPLAPLRAHLRGKAQGNMFVALCVACANKESGESALYEQLEIDGVSMLAPAERDGCAEAQPRAGPGGSSAPAVPTTVVTQGGSVCNAFDKCAQLVGHLCRVGSAAMASSHCKDEARSRDSGSVSAEVVPPASSINNSAASGVVAYLSVYEMKSSPEAVDKARQQLRTIVRFFNFVWGQAVETHLQPPTKLSQTGFMVIPGTVSRGGKDTRCTLADGLG